MNWTKIALVGVLAGLPMITEAAPLGQVFLTKEKQAELAFQQDVFQAATARKKLQYYGGPVISNARAYAVMWGAGVNSEVQSKIGDMLATTLDSDYMDILSQYHTNIRSVADGAGTNQTIGRGSFGGSFTIRPSLNKADLDDTEVGAELERQIDSGVLPKPDGNALYFLYFPPGFSISLGTAKSCQVFCGYHHGVNTKSYGRVYYAVHPDLGGACAMGCGFAETTFDSMTVITAHELAEAVTDPAVTPSADFAPPVAWATPEGEEIGDLCASEITTVTKSDGTRYRLQQAFDNSIGACNKGPFRGR